LARKRFRFDATGNLAHGDKHPSLSAVSLICSCGKGIYLPRIPSSHLFQSLSFDRQKRDDTIAMDDEIRTATPQPSIPAVLGGSKDPVDNKSSSGSVLVQDVGDQTQADNDLADMGYAPQLKRVCLSGKSSLVTALTLKNRTQLSIQTMLLSRMSTEMPFVRS